MDFHRIEIAVVVVHIRRQIVVRQSFVENIAVILDSAQQNHDISFLQGSFDALFTVKNRFAKRVFDDFNRRQGLFLCLYHVLQLIIKVLRLVPRRFRKEHFRRKIAVLAKYIA